ncbi:MAG: hypothetical protein OXR62_11045 [Ahrensia sp.]|nr:hypothetical protein [Ahrensia sp.]
MSALVRTTNFSIDWYACLAAAQRFFPHLSIEIIEEPPHQWFDAALARQIAVHMMRRVLNWPQRQIASETGRSRARVFYSLKTVDQRLIDPGFARAYERAVNGSPTGEERRSHG